MIARETCSNSFQNVSHLRSGAEIVDVQDPPENPVNLSQKDVRKNKLKWPSVIWNPIFQANFSQECIRGPQFFQSGRCSNCSKLWGYGDDEDSLQPFGGSGDDGVDGVISQDLLGLRRISIQART